MFKSVLVLWLSLGMLAGSQLYAADLQKQSTAVVRLFVSSQPWDIDQPWTKRRSGGGTCTGFFIPEGLMTNAHCIADATYIQVEVLGLPDKLEADVKAVNHQVDLALLQLRKPELVQGIKPLSFGVLPKHREKVVTVGYPAGGKQISYTEGIVSRVDVMTSAHSAMPSLLVQTDAAINPGNSGGPVMSDRDGKVLGVATQKNNSGEGLGYFVPVPTIQQFLQDLSDGKLQGIPGLGVEFQTLENDAIRQYYGLPAETSGVRIKDIARGSSADGPLQLDDIVTAIDGKPIQNDGQFVREDGDKIGLGFLIYGRQVGETIPMTVWRAKQAVQVDVQLREFRYALVPPMPRYDEAPRYLLVGGLLIMPVEARHIWRWGRDNTPMGVRAYQEAPIGYEDLDELVVITQVYDDTLNKGYGTSILYSRVVSVATEPVHRFEDIARILDAHKADPYVVLELEDDDRVVIDQAALVEREPGLRQRYNLPPK